MLAWQQHSNPATYILKHLLKNSHTRSLAHTLKRERRKKKKEAAQLHQTSAETHQESLYHNYHNKDIVKLETALLI